MAEQLNPIEVSGAIGTEVGAINTLYSVVEKEVAPFMPKLERVKHGERGLYNSAPQAFGFGVGEGVGLSLYVDLKNEGGAYEGIAGIYCTLGETAISVFEINDGMLQIGVGVYEEALSGWLATSAVDGSPAEQLESLIPQVLAAVRMELRNAIIVEAIRRILADEQLLGDSDVPEALSFLFDSAGKHGLAELVLPE